MITTRQTCVRPAWIVAGLLLLAPARAWAATFYVAPDGDDTHAGSEAAPFASMARAQSAAGPGDTVYFRGGTYRYASASDADGVLLDKSGQAGKPIQYWAYAGETPVFDFSGMSAMARITGLRVTASFVHLKGLTITGVPQNLTTQHESWGIYNTGSHNVFELLDLHHNMGPGLFISKGGDNLVLNCDSHHNYDPKSSSGDGTNADGFGCHIGAGDTGNVIRGCRSWWNSDDGYDLIQAQVPVTIENCWAWRNGYQPDTMTSKGDGNGFKAGGYGIPATNLPADPPSHTVRFSLALLNKASGFYANHHPVADHFYDNTAFSNGANFNMLGLNGNVGILRNNLAYRGTAISNDSGIDAAFNSWDLPVMVSDADFESVDPTGLDGPRKPDGSLPDLPFMKLKADSDLIDKGQDVGLPFNGNAPDLGAFELGGVAIGAAGSSGSAGNAGTGVAASGSSGAPASAASGGTGGASAPGVGGANAGTSTRTSNAGTGARGSAGARGDAGSTAGALGPQQTAGAFAGGAGTGVESSGPAASTNRGCGCRISDRGRARSPLACLALFAFVCSYRRARR